jgi:predicted ribosome quality control (RQC) complex YloA/Tae2 family protein
MALDNLSLSIIADKLSEQMVDTQFGNVLSLSQYDYAFPYSLKDENGIRHGTFIFSLDPTNPFVTYSFERFAKLNNNSVFFNSLKKLNMATVRSVKKHPGERILTISLDANRNDITETNTGYDLILELFPNRPNVYLIAYPYGRIVSVYHEHTDIEKGIFVTRNAIYQYPMERGTLPTDLTDPEQARPYLPNATLRRLKNYVLEQHHDLNDTLHKMVESKKLYVIKKDILSFGFEDKDAKEVLPENLYSTFVEDQKSIAKFEKIRDLVKLIEKALKTANKKLGNLMKDLDEAKDKMKFMEYGQIIYLYQGEIKMGDTLLERDGYHIPLDPKKSAPMNANTYFKKYQKAKSALTILADLIEKTKDEISYLEKKRMEASDGTPRDIQELKSELLAEGYIKEKQGRNTVYKVSKKHRYDPHFINLPKGKIGFGMNGLQNEELTFNQAKKDDLFFHVKDYPGSHVILFDSRDEDMIRLACELALFISHLDNGTVMIAKKKDVKKNPNKIGLVNILKYETVVIKYIRKESLELFRKERKE